MSSIPVFCGKDCGSNACPLLATLENGRITRVANMFTATEGTAPGVACIMHGMAVQISREVADLEASNALPKGVNRK